MITGRLTVLVTVDRRVQSLSCHRTLASLTRNSSSCQCMMAAGRQARASLQDGGGPGSTDSESIIRAIMMIMIIIGWQYSATGSG
jgi:hypothetical protein